ncbi:hypothetical protein NMY22_g6222 [Coprinellus aureogranulatus]|nr:hypothetical protein NMY22_g6222 [Coprinellus aureogranulatus]
MATAKNNPLFNAVADDHQEMYEYYDSYVRAKGNPELQTKWSNQLRWEIARHAVGEEIVIYPLMERYLGEEGVRLADHDRDEHQFVKEKLYTLESLSPGTPEYDALLKSIMDHLHEHNDSEEVNDLPQLFEKIGWEGAEEAAKEFKRTKKHGTDDPRLATAHTQQPRTNHPSRPSSGSSGSPIQLPDASLKPGIPPQSHVITDSSNPEWQDSPIEPPPDSAGPLGNSRSSLFAQHQSDLHNLRRGSLPLNAFPPSSFDTGPPEGPPSSQWFDPLARRRSVDASLQRLAHNPYANLARTKNTALFGERFGMLSASRHHNRVSISRRPPLNHLSSAPHVSNIRRSSMDARLSLRTNALSPAPTNPPPFISSRASLPDHRLYAVTSRVVGSPIPGPLPSPNFSFGAASTPSMASPSSADSERNSPDSLRSFPYSGNDDDSLSSPHFDSYSRFNSIASVATSESSVNSSYYSDFGVDPLLSHADLHNGSRRNSCSPGQFLEFVELDTSGQFGMTETQSLNMGGFPSDEYGIAAPQGVPVPESVSNSYPSPASTISPGNSPHTLDSATVALTSSNLPISKTSELSFALQSGGEQSGQPAERRLNQYAITPSDHEGKDPSASLPTGSGDDTSLPTSTLQQSEHNLGHRGQYTYSPPGTEFYPPSGHNSLSTRNPGLPSALYTSFPEVTSMDTNGLQTVNIESFTPFT